ncbi:hypothetical protein F1559_003464 [Cyanidiococcus yangmingshanensis]|uniref:Uncharacterized protein n=1 Tax=Cyanidiococcus yangmingshanensis TaxID=2690220 RepID=A0A7J7IHK0_9RHOD|nr:hypothetical protein F1559_003464 [Cyanidiococcus yangmingshanensis]
MFVVGAGVFWRHRVGVENRQREASRSRPRLWLQQPRSDRLRLSVKANEKTHNAPPSIVAVQREDSLETSVSHEATRKRSAGTGNGLSQAAAAATSRASVNATQVLHPGDTLVARISDAAPWLALHLATVLWGTQHAVIKSLVDSGFNASVLNMERFGLGIQYIHRFGAGIPACGSVEGRTRSATPKPQRFPLNRRYWRRMLGSWNGAYRAWSLDVSWLCVSICRPGPTRALLEVAFCCILM